MKPVFLIALLALLACDPPPDPRRAVLSDATSVLLETYPRAEAEEHTSTRTPFLYPVWEGASSPGTIPDELLQVMARPGLAILPDDSTAPRGPSTAVLSFFEPQIRGDTILVAANWLFPTDSTFFGQEFELTYICDSVPCRRVSFEHTGTLN